jgi:hypothetical protein
VVFSFKRKKKERFSREKEEKEEKKKIIKRCQSCPNCFWPFVGPLFVFGLCGFVSNQGLFQPIVGSGP